MMQKTSSSPATSTSTPAVTTDLLSAVREAAKRIHGAIYYTPCPYSAKLSAVTGQRVYLKLENMQLTGAFKERGALNKILLLSAEERERGVIAASAGNHAQAVACHATRHAIRSTIVMPAATPLVKVVATQNYGAEVILHGASYDEACQHALLVAAERGLTFLHPFDDLAVIAGQGTIGLELLEQCPELEAVVVPVGGGGLIAGIAAAIKELRPAVKVVGVQTARLPSMLSAMARGGPVTLPSASTIADGIAVRRAGEITFPLVSKYVDEIVTVEDEEIASAILTLLEREKLLAEGAGAAATAALLQRKTSLDGKHTAVLVCGGNIDVSLLSRIIERGLVRDGRLVRIRVSLPDRPGALAELSSVIARQRANIVELQFDRAYYGVSLGDTAIDITLETRGAAHMAELLAAIVDAGYTHERIL
jgi:threonine dehydratase